MHKIIFLLVTFILSSFAASAQKLTETEKIAATAKVRGSFLCQIERISKDSGEIHLCSSTVN